MAGNNSAALYGLTDRLSEEMDIRRITVGKAIDEYLNQQTGLSKFTVGIKKEHLNRFRKFCRKNNIKMMSQLGFEYLHAFSEYLEKGERYESDIQTTLSIFRSFIKFAAERRWVNPVLGNIYDEKLE